MKKNMWTIIVLALQVISIVLTAVLIFVIVPTTNKTSNLMNRVMQIIDLDAEKEKEEKPKEIAVSDITVHKIENQVKINLAKSDDTIHYAALNVSVSVNNNDEETVNLEPKIEENEYAIQDIVSRNFSKYTIDEVNPNIDKIRAKVLTDIQDYFQSDFIVNVSFGNLVMQ